MYSVPTDEICLFPNTPPSVSPCLRVSVLIWTVALDTIRPAGREAAASV